MFHYVRASERVCFSMYHRIELGALLFLWCLFLVSLSLPPFSHFGRPPEIIGVVGGAAVAIFRPYSREIVYKMFCQKHLSAIHCHSSGAVTPLNHIYLHINVAYNLYTTTRIHIFTHTHTP